MDHDAHDAPLPVADLDEVALLERAALNAVPAPRVAWDGPFVVRAFLGGTGRANAACSLDLSPDPGLEGRVARPAAWVVLRREGVPAAVGHAVADDGLVGLFDVATAPAFRRGGLARRIIGALAAWGAEHGGARRCWLQVAPGNAGARALYGVLGMKEAYRYRYFVRR